MKKYCPLLFKEIYSDNRGDYRLCCHARSTGQHSIKNFTPFEFFNSEYMENARDMIINGEELEECQRCYRMEEAGEISFRHQARAQWGHLFDVDKVSLKLRIGTNFCNLSCYMCNPYNSSTREKELGTIYDDYQKVFDRSFKQPSMSLKHATYEEIVQDILNNIEQVEMIHLTGGEPLQLPKQWELLERIPAKYAQDIDISYSTNLTQLYWKNHSIWDVKDKFRNVYLGISCDHYGDKLSFMRYPIDVKQFEDNLLEIATEFNYELNGTVGILNINDLNDIWHYYNNLGIKIGFPNIVSDPQMFSIANLPKGLKADYMEENPKRAVVISELMCENLEPERNWKMALQNLDDLAKHRGVEWRPLWKDFIDKVESYGW